MRKLREGKRLIGIPPLAAEVGGGERVAQAYPAWRAISSWFDHVCLLASFFLFSPSLGSGWEAGGGHRKQLCLCTVEVRGPSCS